MNERGRERKEGERKMEQRERERERNNEVKVVKKKSGREIFTSEREEIVARE